MMAMLKRGQLRSISILDTYLWKQVVEVMEEMEPRVEEKEEMEELQDKVVEKEDMEELGEKVEEKEKMEVKEMIDLYEEEWKPIR
jgi:hypothetical protein